MSESLMPKVDGDSGGVESLRRRWLQWVQIALAITSELHLAGMKILNGKSIRIEFNRYIIVTG